MLKRTNLVLIILILITLMLAGCRDKGKKENIPAPSSLPQVESGVQRTLLYPSADEMVLTAMEIKLPEGKTEEASMVALVERYLKGPVAESQVQPFPENCRLRALYFLNDSEVILDLTGPVNSGGGAYTELSRIYGLIDTLAWNFRRVESVRIMINGSGVDTLLGHVDLKHPIPPEPTLLAPELSQRWDEVRNG